MADTTLPFVKRNTASTTQPEIDIVPIMTLPPEDIKGGEQIPAISEEGTSVRLTMPIPSIFEYDLLDATLLNDGSITIRAAIDNTISVINIIAKVTTPIEGGSDINMGTPDNPTGLLNISNYLLTNTNIITQNDDGATPGDLFNDDITNVDIIVSSTKPITKGAINFKLLRG